MSNFVKCLSKRIFWSIVFLKTFLLVWPVWSLAYIVWTFFILVILGVFTKLGVCPSNFEAGYVTGFLGCLSDHPQERPCLVVTHVMH